jgi:predicted dienelactone hydrolase
MPVAIVPARLDDDKAEPARLEAWLNLSQREKARELVTVRTRAMAAAPLQVNNKQNNNLSEGGKQGRDCPKQQQGGRGGEHTNQGQPNQSQPNQYEQGQADPQQRLDVDGEPEEAAVGGVDVLGAGLARLEDPVAVARGGVDLVPPAQADEAAAGDVLEVVEVGGEEEDGDDEDHDPGSLRQRLG